ncbi:hypothetical protein [Psychrobacter sp. I-STPA6b]|uniref:hypothetical protein n=1 Tax=Psychrobacter sp. I-STPA6b TaxID=2585718 RepID=UPI001D0C085A|nr:hypothetical protein [Psychrobacter sp. I-STPA6b]
MNIRTLRWLSAGMLITLSLTGCQTTKGWLNKVDNGSLDYVDAKQLEPLKLPEAQQTAPFIPLYPTPNLGENTLPITKEDSKRYELPPPPHRMNAS